MSDIWGEMTRISFWANLAVGENKAAVVMQALRALRIDKPYAEIATHQPRLPILAKDIEAEPIAEL